ncbi:MAG: capsular biosynthesis protein [Candidatus Dactylopiibacterium carminicum]|uniref:Capsular biosynthesis protein n=2 Tax=Candidatus Dactylopiibacterium carminicum TaxID=857335 RepID=A0A272ESW9_9RHOO|nr:capsular biosynthesis protein [Candidatus Dactylopiibacterium carminicum]PAS93126.1 MAG: capsular biosynthesis protein [Candidatus Dactylopiibacterium carminicum]PAS99126.1 MAG: hypothetical protein BSR46_09840 [Candidatus Dactylopiibacterium carminicum]
MLLAFVLTALAEACLMQPRPFLRRPAWTCALHAGSVGVLFVLGLLVFRRPWFAACQPLAWHFLLLAVNWVKRDALREPFVFQDFEYFVDLLRHPRLYLPFFGYCNALLGIAAAVIFITTGMLLEPGLDAKLFRQGVLLSALLTVLALLVGWWHGRRIVASFDADADLRCFGLAANLWLYALAERRKPQLPSRFVGQLSLLAAENTPHLVVVQSESFFDARRVYEGVAPSVYAWLDAAKADAVLHGLLEVPAWGANTVRSEFAFLSGLRNEALGVHRFNPYRRLREVDTVAWALRRAGYRTVCVHPYSANFYQRDRQFPLFGFDEFVDIRAFSAEDRVGAYIGDIAVADRVAELLQAADAPLFVFVITMENHGPLHLETVGAGDEAMLYSGQPPSGHADLTAYLRHIVNAGQMQQRLCDCLAAQSRDGWLCWYGDHLPIMPSVYRQAGFEDARTDYFIWHARRPASASTRRDMHMADLAENLLSVMQGAR